ncbi:MAG TPA: SPFH domain-containing protein [Candidatus Diapherotrites archaeon]|uniref:SPFH domain-containing protein n=1 Tax=Candidatus Iainarchaeum sp. TaxID=3101447 RepID=A0A7J4IY67_9ARCH|nr:SPFH domain-containing protein [Candidatus Diapherotrites archaeon]
MSDHESHGPHSAGKDNEFKRSLFVVLVVFLALSAIVVFRSAQAILNNPLVVAFFLFILVFFYLVSRYDYLLQLKEYKRAVIFRFGKVNRVGGPGWAIVFPPFETHEVVELRTQTIDIPKQDVVTKDNIEVMVDAAAYIHVRKDNASVINSVTQVEDYVKAVETFVMAQIRAESGKLELSELIYKIDELDKSLKKELEKLATSWGVGVENVVIQDIQIPKAVLDAMHEQKAAVQKRLARLENAQAQQAEILAVKEAAQQLNDKVLAYYYIRALEKLGEGKSTKIIFPMELTNLAKALTGRQSLGPDELEDLMKRYEPVVKALAGKDGKKK